MSCKEDQVERPIPFIKSLPIKSLSWKWWPNQRGYKLFNGRTKPFSFIRYNIGNTNKTAGMYMIYIYVDGFDDPEDRFVNEQPSSNRPEWRCAFNPNNKSDVQYATLALVSATRKNIL